MFAFTRQAAVLILLLLMSACTLPLEEYRYESLRNRGAGFGIKPVVIISDFENRASFSGQWNLGSGMADMLVTEMMKTEEVVILDRRHMGDILQELSRQRRGDSREEGKAKAGRLRNAQFLVRGTVTDFTVTGDVSGWFSVPKVKGALGGSTARVELHLSISDVETGEIVGSVKGVGRASKGFLGAAADYPKMAFGGEAFFRTPLGVATREAIVRAMEQVLGAIPVERWEARVAEVGEGMIVVNGGENVGLRVGREFVIRQKGRDITDPTTGDVIDRMPGPVTGRLKVYEVRASAAYAHIVEGVAARGDYLESVPLGASSDASPKPADGSGSRRRDPEYTY